MVRVVFDKFGESLARTKKFEIENYQVCDLGRFDGVPHFSIVNNCGPFDPYNSLKPVKGAVVIRMRKNEILWIALNSKVLLTIHWNSRGTGHELQQATSHLVVERQ